MYGKGRDEKVIVLLLIAEKGRVHRDTSLDKTPITYFFAKQ
jgi:hypothetical protein